MDLTLYLQCPNISWKLTASVQAISPPTKNSKSCIYRYRGIQHDHCRRRQHRAALSALSTTFSPSFSTAEPLGPGSPGMHRLLALQPPCAAASVAEEPLICRDEFSSMLP